MPKDSLSHHCRHTKGATSPQMIQVKKFFLGFFILVGLFVVPLLVGIVASELRKMDDTSLFPPPGESALNQKISTTSDSSNSTNSSSPTSVSIPSIYLDLMEKFACLNRNMVFERAELIGVVNGDSITVNIRDQLFTVRYIGIISPEFGSEYYKQSLDFNSRLLSNGDLILVKDVSEKDNEGVLPRYVFAGGKFLNYEMVRSGMAKSSSLTPDMSCTTTIDSAETTAKAFQAGIWSIHTEKILPTSTARFTFLQTKDSVGSSCPSGCTQSKPGCVIKGNISFDTGEKIYHLPGMEYYSSTIIDPSYGERWFCTEVEAINNSWRKAEN